MGLFNLLNGERTITKLAVEGELVRGITIGDL